eukprot:jgi/Antlo1/1944/116
MVELALLSFCKDIAHQVHNIINVFLKTSVYMAGLFSARAAS